MLPNFSKFFFSKCRTRKQEGNQLLINVLRLIPDYFCSCKVRRKTASECLLFLRKKKGLLRFLFLADAKTVVPDGAILYKQYALNVGIRKVHGRENEISGVAQRKRMIGRGQPGVLLRIGHGVVIHECLLVGYRNVFHGAALAHSVEHLPANA